MFASNARTPPAWRIVQGSRLDASRLAVPPLPACIALSLDAAADLRGELPPYLGDIVALLARNAVDAMPRGGRLQISLGERSLPSDGARLSRRHLSLSVKDDGLGLTPQMLQRVFDNLSLHDDWGSRRVLRLRRVRQIARLHGGKLFVDGALGYGSCVQVYLPCSAPIVASRQRPAGARTPAAP